MYSQLLLFPELFFFSNSSPLQKTPTELRAFFLYDIQPFVIPTQGIGKSASNDPLNTRVWIWTPFSSRCSDAERM